jgi:hypothetical protein
VEWVIARERHPFDLRQSGRQEPGQAFARVEKGLKEKSDAIQYLKTNHMSDSLPSDLRYADMLKRMAIPQ